jgi:hypothetical protein
MGTITTSNYRSGLVRLFVDDVFMNNYYLFVSSTANTTVSNTRNSRNDFLEKTLFGKAVDTDEVFFMIKNYPWASNSVYDQYDDVLDLSGKRYYAVVYPQNNQTGDYRIYKCLFNNYGAESINPPNYSVSTPDQIYVMPDGYVWKFMYSLSELEFEKYNTRGYIPIPNNANNGSSNTAIVDSSIDQIFVTNLTNRGYEKLQGSISEINAVTGEIAITGLTPSNPSAIENYYAGYTFYVTLNFASQTYEVESYSFNSSTKTAIVQLKEGAPNDGVLIKGSTVLMVPRIEIRGNGSGANAVLDVLDNGTVRSIKIIDKGIGYTSATATVPDPFSFNPASFGSVNERVLIRPVLSPPGGHGSNLVNELSCRHALVYINISNFDNIIIPTTNDFSSVGLVKNPRFKTFSAPAIFDNRIELALDSHNLSANEFVTQIETADTTSDFYNEVRFRGKVHEVSNNFIYLCEYMGPFPNDVDTFANTNFSDISLKINLPLLSSNNQNEILMINTDNDPVYPAGYDIDYPGFNLSPYVQRSGEVYYMSSFSPITRTEESRERFKILLEF